MERSGSEHKGKKDYSVSARKISNGWVVSESWIDGKGNFKSKETYSEKNPLKPLNTALAG